MISPRMYMTLNAPEYGIIQVGLGLSYRIF